MPDVASAPTASTLDADVSHIRYAQCWEDADVLVEGLDVQPGDVCLSIASAGDNALALLTRDPGRVIAIDLSAAQLACLALRVAAYRTLSHSEVLELVGSEPSSRRRALYRRCRPRLEAQATRFWDDRLSLVDHGIGAAGRFERYLRLFRRFVLPLTQSSDRVDRLLQEHQSVDERRRFYDAEWNHWRWRLLFRGFFSQFLLGRLGRDPSFFEHVSGSVADRLLARSRHGLTALDPSANPYLQWMLTGRHRTARPLALRAKYFEVIRSRLDRLEWHQASLEETLAHTPPNTIDAFNLSDMFEYVGHDHYQRLLAQCTEVGRTGARLAYWNLFVPRHRPPALADDLEPCRARAERLHAHDKTFFYGDFVLEDVR